METYNLAEVTKLIYGSGFKLFRLKTIRDILEVKSEVSLKKVVARLVSSNVLRRLERDKYLLQDAQVSDFELANFLYSPSYVSLETALNFYGILSQFPYEITSVTLKKSIKKEVDGKLFAYMQVKKGLFWGYKKQDGVLIAEPAKALLDQIYLFSKGLRSINLDEYDLSGVDKIKIARDWERFPKVRQTMKVNNLLEKIVR